MSLINEALKKAQQMRSGEESPGPQQPISGISTSSGADYRDVIRLALGVSGGILVICGAVALLGYGIVKVDRNEEAVADSNRPTPAASDRAAASSGGLVNLSGSQPGLPDRSEAKPESVSAGHEDQPPVTVISFAAPPSRPEVIGNSEAGQMPQQTRESKPDNLSAPAKEKAPMTVVEFIDSLVVNGVRLSGKKSKVLLGSRVFRKNSVVNKKLKLKILEIKSGQIEFIDIDGITYTKYF